MVTGSSPTGEDVWSDFLLTLFCRLRVEAAFARGGEAMETASSVAIFLTQVAMSSWRWMSSDTRGGGAKGQRHYDCMQQPHTTARIRTAVRAVPRKAMMRIESGPPWTTDFPKE